VQVLVIVKIVNLQELFAHGWTYFGSSQWLYSNHKRKQIWSKWSNCSELHVHVVYAMKHRKLAVISWMMSLVKKSVYTNLKYQSTALFGQVRASWSPTCLHFPHVRLLLPLLAAFISLLFLILLHLPFDLISFGGCISTWFGILLPRKDSYSSCLLTLVAGVIFWRGSTRLDKLENKKSIPILGHLDKIF